jgi:hypothetical protein
MKVKCIDNTAVSNFLEVDKIYEVDLVQTAKNNVVHPGTYYLIGVGNYNWRSSRFVIVEGVLDNKSSAIENKIIKGSFTSQLTEQQLRAMLMPKILPGECICGVSKKVCIYHNGS